ncbi:MAG TPA: NAD(P)H-dependent oxidoreductase subunit E [Solirubrobacteraceae bacterium]|jgi:NADH:ubiquinone oxidoreductase subunit E|nr:NAD(P)H-dependent oxidoreductase subunit E [Solirubrobacteraceae bacterium]
MSLLGRRNRTPAKSTDATPAQPAAGHNASAGTPAQAAAVSIERRRLQHARIPRYAHGSRVPGWDDAVDLTKDPAELPDPAQVDVPRALRLEIEAAMAQYPDSRSAALPALAAAQRHHGWCSPEAIEQAACVMRLTPGYLTAVATFYDMFEMHPAGKHAIYVCTNISCSLCGADDLHAAISHAVDGDADFNVRSFECLGACDIAPMASVNGIYVGPISLDEVDALVDDLREGRSPLPAKQLNRRPSTDAGANDYPGGTPTDQRSEKRGPS